MNPEFLLLDEPLSALDALTRAQAAGRNRSHLARGEEDSRAGDQRCGRGVVAGRSHHSADAGTARHAGARIPREPSAAARSQGREPRPAVSPSARGNHAVPAGRRKRRSRVPAEGAVQTARRGADHLGGFPAEGGARGQQAEAAVQSRQVRRVLQRSQGVSDAEGPAHRGRRIPARHQAWRMRLADRALRLRQIHGAVDVRRSHGCVRRRHHARWTRSHQRRPRSRRGVPGAESAVVADRARRTSRSVWIACIRMRATRNAPTSSTTTSTRVGLARFARQARARHVERHAPARGTGARLRALAQAAAAR